jgi:RHS repeat-associated protein
LSAVNFPVHAASANGPAPVVSKPLPPGKISNGPLKLPAFRPDQPAPRPGSAEAKAVAGFKAAFAAELAAPHHAPGPAKPAQILTAEAKLAALKARHLLTQSPVLAESSGKTRIRDVHHGPALPVTTITGPAVAVPASGPAQPVQVSAAVVPRASVMSKVYGATYSISAVSPIPTYSTFGAVGVTVTNTGNFTWTTSDVVLGYHMKNVTTGAWYNFDGPGTRLSASVPPGYVLSVELLIEFMPAGKYQVFPDLFDNADLGGPGWFSQQSPPVPVTATSVFTVPHLVPTASMNAPLAGATLDTQHPQFQVTVSADGTAPVSAEFQACDAPSASATCWDSGWLSVSINLFTGLSSWTPTQTMFWNKTYYWRIRVKDTLTGVWSDFSDVTPVVPSPAGPAHYGVDPASVDPAGVNLFMGNLTQQATDINIGEAGVPLQIQRTYNSFDTPSRGFGTGWSSLLDMKETTAADGTVTITFPDGRQERYGKNPDGTWVPSYGQGADATITGGGTGVMMADGTVYSFDATTGALFAITGADGSDLILHSDSSGHIYNIQSSPGGHTLNITWTGSHVTQVAAPGRASSLTWNYTYSGNTLTRVCDPDAHCTGYGYGGTDSTHTTPRLTSIQKPDAANLTHFVYSGDRVEEVEYPPNGDGSSGTWTYGSVTPSGNDPEVSAEINVTDPAGVYSDYRFNDQGALLFRVMVSPDAGMHYTREWDYDLLGQPDGMMDENGTVTDYNYAGGRLVATHIDRTTTGPEITTLTQYYTSGALGDPRNGKPVAVTDGNGNTTSYSYDLHGLLLTQTDPSTAAGSGVTTNAYTCENLAPAPPAVDTGDEPCNLLASTTDPAGLTTRYRYDNNGDLAETITPGGVQTSYTHDEFGRLTAKVVTTRAEPGSAGTSYTYNGEGQVLTETGPPVTNPVTGVMHQLQITNTYDGDGNLTKTVQSDVTGADASRTVLYTYDARDRQATVTSNGVLTSSTVYNGVGQETENMTASGADYHFFYDGEGNLQSVWLYGFVDNPASPGTPRHVELNAYTYDWAGRLDTQFNAMNESIAYDYTYDGLLSDEIFTGYIDPDTGAVRSIPLHTYTYDDAGNMLSDVEGSGATARFTTMTYDAVNQRLMTTLQGAGGFSRTTTTHYDLDGRVTEVDSPDDVQYSYDAYGQLGSVVTDLGPGSSSSASYVHDGAGHLQDSTDARSRVTANTYDILGRLSTTAAPAIAAEDGTGATQIASPTTTYGYDTFGDKTDVEDPNGNVTHIKYDTDGRRTEIDYPGYTTPAGATITATEKWTYTPDGQVASHTDRGGNTTTYLYDQRDRPVQVTQPPATPGGTPGVTSYVYDDAGDLLSQIAPNGAQTLWTYDSLERPVSVDKVVRGTSTPTQIITNYRYDDFGDLTSVSGGAVRQTATYDAAGDRLTLTTPGQGTTAYAYNATGEVTSVTDGTNRTTTTTYDAAGRETGVTTPAGTTSYSLDGNGNITSMSDPDGHVRSMGYNGLNQLVRITDPDPSTASGTPLTAPATTFGYDLAGNQTRVTDSDGNSTYQTYNSWNLPQTTTVPATTAYPDAAHRQTTVTYDSSGRASHVAEPAGAMIDSAYDQLGRLVSQAGASVNFGSTTNVSKSFGYDAVGNLTSISTPNGAQNYTYNDMGQLTGSTGPLGTSSYSYDTAGRLATDAEPGGTTSYTYNPNTTAVATRTTAAGTTAFTYNNAGQLASEATTVGGTAGSSISLGYDSDGRLTTQDLWSNTNTLIGSVAYTWDAAGNLTSQNINIGSSPHTDNYTYDADNRLIQDANTTAGTGTDYAWDSVGNRTAVTNWTGTPASHTITSTTTATYDQRDELLSTSNPSGSMNYTWDARGTQLTANGYRPDGSFLSASTTQFDAFNQLLSYTTGGVSTNYSYDALGRMVSNGSATFTYGGLSAEPSSDGTFKVTRDPAGTATAITRAGSSAAASLLETVHGDLVATYNPSGGTPSGTSYYDPFGDVTGTSGSAAPLGYQGSWTDTTSGKLMAEARMYDPATGTFLSPDPSPLPVTTAAGANSYLYANANPTTYNDPTGRWNPVSALESLGSDVTQWGQDAVSFLTNEAAAGVSAVEEFGSEALAVAEEVGPDLGMALCDSDPACLAAELVALGIYTGLTINAAENSGQSQYGANQQPSISNPQQAVNQANQPTQQPHEINPARPPTPHPVSTRTWTEKGTPWTEPGGESWDSTYLYTYTDHYQYVTTYQQTLYSDGSLSPVQNDGSKLSHWRTVVRQAILDGSHPVVTPAMSAAAQKRFNDQVPGAPDSAQSGAGCGGGGPPSDCAQTGPHALPVGVFAGSGEPQPQAGASGGGAASGNPPTGNAGACEPSDNGDGEWVDPQTINFSQRTVSPHDYAQLMREGQWDWNRPGTALRVIDVGGQLVSYDNRRLDAAREVGDPVRVSRVNPDDAFPDSTTGKTWWDKFKQRFNDPRNLRAGGCVPDTGLNERPDWASGQ